MKLTFKEFLAEAKTAFIAPGREVIVGSGDYRQYADVQRIEDGKVYLTMAGRKKPIKYDIEDIQVELGRKIVPAQLAEGKVYTLRNPGIKPKGAPEPWEAARAFDKKPKDRSYMRDDKPGYHTVEYEITDDAIWVHVTNQGDFEKRKEQRGDSYYGVNVLFHDDGKIEASTGDKFAAAQWREDKDKIIAVAQAFMKKKNLKKGKAPKTDDKAEFSAEVIDKGDGKWPWMHGEIYEKGVKIGTFSRAASKDGHVSPIVAKFTNSAARNRFDDFADSNSIGETIEALLP